MSDDTDEAAQATMVRYGEMLCIHGGTAQPIPPENVDGPAVVLGLEAHRMDDCDQTDDGGHDARNLQRQVYLLDLQDGAELISRVTAAFVHAGHGPELAAAINASSVRAARRVARIAKFSETHDYLPAPGTTGGYL